MRNLIKNLETLNNKINGVIGTTNDSEIVPLLDCQWSLSDDGKYLNFDRYDIGDMWEYSRYQISSLGTKQENLFKGERDGLFFVMAHEEDCNWDDTSLLIFDNKNKIEWNSEDW